MIRVREFARLGGVTVKALIHYDRLGLLTPARTSAGHRAYTSHDLERLRRILALKRVGIALTRMGDLLDADPSALTIFLETSRRTLAHEQRRLLHTGRAIALVEESLRHAPDDDNGLSRLADVLDMPRAVACMERYFAPDVWEQARRFYEDWPGEEWIELFRSLAAAIPDGPGSACAEELLTRWNTLAQSLWRGLATDPDRSRKLHDGFARAWRDRENWPDTLKRRFADYQMNEVAAFLARISVAVFSRRGPRWFAEQRQASTGSNQGAGV